MKFFNIINDGKLNWEAISSLATLLAVFVALLPTFTEQKKRRTLARNLRVRILNCLVLIEVALENYVDSCEFADCVTLFSKDSQVEALRSLEIMLPEMMILTESEYRRLIIVIADIKMLEIKPKKLNRKDLQAFKELIRELGHNVNKRIR